jgi:hypothetical protein
MIAVFLHKRRCSAVHKALAFAGHPNLRNDVAAPRAVAPVLLSSTGLLWLLV